MKEELAELTNSISDYELHIVHRISTEELSRIYFKREEFEKFLQKEMIKGAVKEIENLGRFQVTEHEQEGYVDYYFNAVVLPKTKLVALLEEAYRIGTLEGVMKL